MFCVFEREGTQKLYFLFYIFFAKYNSCALLLFIDNIGEQKNVGEGVLELC